MAIDRVAGARNPDRMDRDWHPTEAEHRALGALSEQLDGLLSELAADGGRQFSEVSSLLEEFHRRLLGHLAAEENRGILERAANSEPRLARRVEQLLVEHGALRRGVAELATGPDSGDAGTDWTGFYARFAAFRRILHDHEQAENEVLHNAYMDDLGGG